MQINPMLEKSYRGMDRLAGERRYKKTLRVHREAR